MDAGVAVEDAEQAACAGAPWAADAMVLKLSSGPDARGETNHEKLS